MGTIYMLSTSKIMFIYLELFNKTNLAISYTLILIYYKQVYYVLYIL